MILLLGYYRRLFGKITARFPWMIREPPRANDALRGLAWIILPQESRGFFQTTTFNKAVYVTVIVSEKKLEEVNLSTVRSK